MKKVIVVIFIVSLFTQCDNDAPSPQNQVQCETPATVKDLSGLDGCGFVFELSDGTRLEPLRIFFCGTPPQPAEVTDDPLYNFEFADGKKVLINFEYTDEYASICMAGRTVKITCLTEVSNTPD
ncbi:MAG: hypothetical protein ACOYXT_27815 [Bacteroidota bacterium]